MYSVGVRDHVMIAHSFRGEVFGPAQRLRGATYVVDVEFKRRTIDADGIVIDIGRAGDVLKQVLSELNYRNLDDLPEFAGRNPSIEHFARILCETLSSCIKAPNLSALGVVVWENEIAWAAYRLER